MPTRAKHAKYAYNFELKPLLTWVACSQKNVEITGNLPECPCQYWYDSGDLQWLPLAFWNHENLSVPSLNEHSGPTCHSCHPMPPPASNTSKASLPEVGLRLQDGRQKQPPTAFPHLQSIGQQPESPSPASRSDAQAAAPLILPQGSIGLTRPS